MILLSLAAGKRTACFYGPTEPFFDKSWRLPDFEKV
jgi:hypothetical protein